MSSSRYGGNDRRQQASAARNLDFQHDSRPISQFANLSSHPTGSSQPLSQFDHQQSHPQNEYRETFSQFGHHQPFSELLHSQQSTFCQPSQHLPIETPEENAYHEQRQHFHNTQSEYRTPETVVTGRGRKGKEKEVVHAPGYRQKWKEWEDIILARCWCNKTESTYDTRESKFWAEITDMYNEDVMKKGGNPRELKALQNRWHKQMKPQGTNYVAAYNKVTSNVKSGENRAKTLERVRKQYIAASPKNEAFQFFHVIDILLNCQKFCATSTTGRYPTLDNVDLEYLATPQSDPYYTGTPQSDNISDHSSGKRKSTSDSNTDDVDDVSSPAKSGRPEGVKKRKMKAKKRLEQILEINPELEAARNMRQLELNFENARLAHHTKYLQLKQRESTLRRLNETRELADTPEALTMWKAQKQWYLQQWMREDGAPCDP